MWMAIDCVSRDWFIRLIIKNNNDKPRDLTCVSVLTSCFILTAFLIVMHDVSHRCMGDDDALHLVRDSLA